jgi:hypothetical protein
MGFLSSFAGRSVEHRAAPLKAPHERGAIVARTLIFEIRQALIVVRGARLITMRLAPRAILCSELSLSVFRLSGASHEKKREEDGCAANHDGPHSTNDTPVTHNFAGRLVPAGRSRRGARAKIPLIETIFALVFRLSMIFAEAKLHFP